MRKKQILVSIFLVFHSISLILAFPITAFTQVKTIWAENDGEKIKQDDINNPLKAGNSVWDGSKISIFGAKNEIVAFQIIVEAGVSGANNVNLTISDLTDGTNTIGNDFSLSGADKFDMNNSVGRRIQLFKQHYLHISEPSRPLYFRKTERLNGVGWWPDPLIPFDVGKKLGGAPFDIAAKLNQGIWVDIYIPKDTPAGVYMGLVTITENNGMNPYAIPLVLTVYDFVLTDKYNLRTIAFIGDERRIAERHGIDFHRAPADYFQVENQYAKMAHRHRLNLVIERYMNNEGQPYFPLHLYLSGELYNSDNGYEGPGENFGDQLFLPAVDAGDDATVKSWYSWFKKNKLSWRKAFWYIWDEPSPDNYPDIKQQADWMHSFDNPLKIFLTEYINSDLIKGLKSEYIDIWCPPADEGSQGYNITAAGERQAAGYEVGTYNGHRPGAGTALIDDDAIAMRSWGWIAFKHNIDLWYYWDVAYWSDVHNDGQQTDVWNDPLTFDGRSSDWENLGNGDGTIFYPGEDQIYPSGNRAIKGPISSIRMKNWRRGLQDYEYLYLATQAGYSSEVNQIIAEIIPSVLSDAAGLSTKSWPSRSAPWEKARQNIRDLIYKAKVEYTLSIFTTIGGTTDPAPGNYTFNPGTEVSVTARPYTQYRFSHWGDDVLKTANPITITMDSDKSVTANFIRMIYPPLNFTGQKVMNRSLFMTEYINVLHWKVNPNNVNIAKYRIYLVKGESQDLLVELSTETFEYWQRGVDKDIQYPYAIVAVSDEDIESEPACIIVR